MNKYNPQKIESKWQKYWEKNKTFQVTENPKKQKFYGLIEFPYPSGAGLHVGHPRPFTAMDVICRKKRMEGYNVLYPIGFDAFGLPTENYAIKTGRPPAEVTAENIKNFTRQLKMLGYSFDWSRVVDTTDPKYYKWTQWIFLQLFKHGLAYKKAMPINWCPSCKIGLANEEAVGGVCERCGTPAEKKNKEQWMLAITKYADKLLEGLKHFDYIPQAKIQQENWIGRSEGALVKFVIATRPLAGKQSQGNKIASSLSAPRNDTLEVFTTRPDTLFGATYMVVAPEHSLIENFKFQISNLKEVEKYLEKSKNKTEQERAMGMEKVPTQGRDARFSNQIEDLEKIGNKTGVELKGLKAINQVNNEEIPIFVADYVLMGYGTGAIMAVPAHDERDFEFAKKYGLEIKEVVVKKFGDIVPTSERRDGVAAIIINQHNQIYVQKWSYGGYEIPGGRYEKNESDEEALRREIIEETGYTDWEAVDYLGTIQPNFDIPQTGKRRLKYQKCFVLKLKSETKQSLRLEKGEDFVGVWMSLKEALSLFEKTNTNGQTEFLYRAMNRSMNFCGEGVNINSDFLNSLSTPEAKEKMIVWLEEKGIGKRQVQYKLRDWVFSRQRYWGEPIPLVYCENCKNKKYNYVFIHGYGSSAEESWKPWVKGELEKAGHEVVSFDLPNTENPQIIEQANFLLSKAGKIDEQTIFIGHSLGGVVLLKVLEIIKTKIAKAIFVDGFINPVFNDKPRPAVEASCDWQFDFGKIKKMAKEFIVLGDLTEVTIPKKENLALAEKLGVEVIFAKPEERHFKSKIEPAVLNVAQNTGWIPLPESALPLELPKVKKYEPTDTGESPLAAMEKWVKTKCPVCGGPARRETDTMPNWAGSSWYFLAYTMPKSPLPPFTKGGKEEGYVWDREKMDYWLPVDWYNGGMEHTVLHLLYSRFWNQFLYDLGLVPTSEPYQKRTSHGMILAQDGEKMSKSRGNVINPDEMVEKFGTDSFRVYIMFMGPFGQAVAWDTNGLVGVRRFLEKVWTLQDRVILSKAKDPIVKERDSSAPPPAAGSAQNDKTKLDTLLHQTIKKVSEDIEAMRFNTAISQLMILTNEMSKEQQLSITNYQLLITLLSPFAPHLCEEMWHALGNKESISQSAWPNYDPKLIVEDTITIAVQVNGKLRGTFTALADISEDEAKKTALASANIKKWLENKEPKKVIYVKGKLVSIVV